MLSSAEIVENVADRLEAWGVTRLVVDPVMVAKSGQHLLQPAAVDALRTHLLPLALVVTPNIAEAETLSGRSIASVEDAREAARAIAALGAHYVVVKGGHLAGDPTDLVFDGEDFHQLFAHRVETTNTHGTGCTFAAAITARLAHGADPIAAIADAKEYVTDALAASYAIGDGHSPVNHLYAFHRAQAAHAAAGAAGHRED
jgi:hydroxymethylpyrimidine/phosphomethylpyrimidine kinase